MDINIQLILTHILGFAITVFILAKFAWKPILKVMNERREKIKSEFDHIESEKTSVSDLKTDYEDKLKDIDNLSRQKMTEAINEGQKVAAEIKTQSQTEAKEIINRAKAELERDVDKARAALKEDMVKMTMMAAEKIITTKLDETEHRRLISEYIDNIEKA